MHYNTIAIEGVRTSEMETFQPLVINEEGGRKENDQVAFNAAIKCGE